MKPAPRPFLAARQCTQKLGIEHARIARQPACRIVAAEFRGTGNPTMTQPAEGLKITRAHAHRRNVEDAARLRAFYARRGGTVACARTVTSCPSGKRTPLASTTTPSCTRPRTTMGNLVQWRVSRPVPPFYISSAVREKTSCFVLTSELESLFLLITPSWSFGGNQEKANHVAANPPPLGDG
jgi:hypothetical protein